MTKLSDYVIRFIADQGVKHVFLVTGGGAMHLNDSLSHCTEIEPVCNSHEQASSICAEHYAKVTDNLGVAMVTTGPGGTNAVTGLTGAWLDSTPCLFVSGQVKRPDRMFHVDGTPKGMRQLGVQEVDIVSIVKPVTKYAVTLLEPKEIRYHLEKAVHLARTGRPGPVWIDIPLDVQAAPINEEELTGFDPHDLTPEMGESALRDTVRDVIAAMNQSQRPLLFAGNGIRLARATQEFEELLELLRVPVAATWCACDLISSENPLFVGRPGSVASRGANFAIQNCDLLLSIGVRLDFAITGYAPEKLARAATRIVVDIDPAELEKLSPHVQMPICTDAGDFLREMLRQKNAIQRVDRHDWDARCANWKTRYPLVTDEHRRTDTQVSVYNLAEVISQETTADDLMVCGSSGSAIEVYLLAAPTRTRQRIYHCAALGSMGFALPGSIAICVGGGRKRTIVVDGDGGFQFNIQELETVSRLNLPIKYFVLNNNGYASIRASQTAWFGKPSIGCDRGTGLSVPNLSKVADSYGIKAMVIENQADLHADVRRVLEYPGPVVCDVHVIPNESREPRLSSVQKPDGSLVSRPLEDLFPFLPREEFRANMIVPVLED